MTFQDIVEGTDDFTAVYGVIKCKDGTTLSVQASRAHYCTPRMDGGPYTHVEIGFPSVRPPNEWEQYFDGIWQAPGFWGYIKRVWSDRGSIWYSIKNGLQEKRWRYFNRLVTLQDNATTSVYGYVPVELVEKFIEEHGGEENNEK